MTTADFKKLLDESLKPVKEDLKELKQDVSGLKEDMAEVKRVQEIHTKKLDAIWEQTSTLAEDAFEMNERVTKLEKRAGVASF